MNIDIATTQPSFELDFSQIDSREAISTAINKLLAQRFSNHAEEYTFSETDYKRLIHQKGRLKRYKSFELPKRSGGTRTIQAPEHRLKSVLMVLAAELERMTRPHLLPSVVGFVNGRSIVDGARQHVGKRFVFNTDLADFFGSIEFGRVKACLALPPFNCKGEKGSPLETLAFELANIFTLPMEVERVQNGKLVRTTRSVLPQGAPTSPVLTNIVCRNLDRRVSGLAKKYGLSYTRYADDITFSSNHNVYQPQSRFRQQLDQIIESEGFRQNLKKVRLQPYTQRQMVTGLVVNERVNVTQGYIKQIREWLNVWESKGFDAAQAAYNEHKLRAAAGRLPKGVTSTAKGSNIANVLAGKIDFLRMVDGGAHNHFDGVSVADIEAGKSKFTEVSARHTKQNARLNKLIEAQAAREMKHQVVVQGKSEVPKLGLDDDYLYKLIYREEAGN